MIRHIVDASTMGALIIPDEAKTVIPEVVEILVVGRAVVPQHWRLEVANLARMAVRKRRLTELQLVSAFDAIRGFSVQIDAETATSAWARTLELAGEHDLTAYDAAYLELAMRAGLPLATRDGPLARAARRACVPVLGR